MIPNQDPERLVDASGAPGDLRLARRAARAAAPDATELRLLAERIHLDGGSSPPPPPPSAQATQSASLAKTIAVLALAACGLLFGLDRRGDRPDPRPEIQTSELPAATAANPAVLATPTTPTMNETAAPAAEATAVTPAPSPATRRDAPESHLSVVDPNGEARLLTEARAELKEHASRALALADEHQRRFADGRLQEEREVIAITALVHLGRVEEASERWGAFRARFDRSAYAPRLLALFAPFDKSIEKSAAPSPLTR
jgi:hypothetical protein